MYDNETFDKVADEVANDMHYSLERDLEVEYDNGYNVAIYSSNEEIEELSEFVEKDQDYEILTGIVNPDRLYEFYKHSDIYKRQKALAEAFFVEAVKESRDEVSNFIDKYDYEFVIGLIEEDREEGEPVDVYSLIDDLKALQVSVSVDKSAMERYWDEDSLYEYILDNSHPGYSYYDDWDSTGSIYEMIAEIVSDEEQEGLLLEFKEVDWDYIKFDITNTDYLSTLAVKALKEHKDFAELSELSVEKLEEMAKSEDEKLKNVGFDVSVVVEEYVTAVEDGLTKSLNSGRLGDSVDSEAEFLDDEGVFNLDARSTTQIAESVKECSISIESSDLIDKFDNVEWVVEALTDLKG